MTKKEFDFINNNQESKSYFTSKYTSYLISFVALISFILFLKLSPYSSEVKVAHSLSDQIFYIYFFIINQTLGIVHEGGHGVCYILGCPDFITALNGTVFQLLFPFLVGYYYKRRGDKLAYYIGLFVFGISLYYTSWYISTSGNGPIVSAENSFLGVDGYHDFYKVLGDIGLLSYYSSISALVKIIAFFTMLYSVISMFIVSFQNCN